MVKMINFRKGGISIFVVIMVSILVSIMSVGFLRLMLRDQEQASKLDLSQSAYDSAQAGIEDAKRFLRIYRGACNGRAVGNKVFEGRTYDCDAMHRAVQGGDCYTLATAGIGVNGAETIIQTTNGTGGTSNDANLNQAYTCVKIQMNTADFLGRANEGAPSVVSLRGVSGFNQVKISWHSKENLANGTNISLDSVNNPNMRPDFIKNWRSKNRPAIIKAQLYGYVPGNPNSSTSMDTPYSDDGNGSAEMLLYPANGSDLKVSNNSNLPTVRRDENSSNATTDYTFTRCLNRLDASSNTYACEMVINIGREVSVNDMAYLRLTPMMNEADFKVQLMKNSAIVDFNGSQPKVDSTGRANTQFRRVEGRVGFHDTNFPVPLFSAQTEGSEPICKDFSTTKIRNSGLDCRI